MRILILSTWFPYPLSQGSKIRAYHLIKALAQNHRLALISFADLPIEDAWLTHMNQFCEQVRIVEKNPFQTRQVGKVIGWLSNQPSFVRASYSPQMSALVQQFAREWQPDCILAFTFVMAPYVLEVDGVSKWIDVDNFMSPMLRDALVSAPNLPERLRRFIAWRKMLNYERHLYPRFDSCLVVTDQDRRALSAQLGLDPSRLLLVPNGVDCASFVPQDVPPQPDTLVFNGSLTYQANFDAMAFFLREVFPLIRARRPHVRLHITGRLDGVPLSSLGDLEQVTLTGYLDDIRPLVSSNWLCVAPLRIGGGTRIKILEAIALGTPVVSTSKGAQGLDLLPEEHILLADTPSEFAAAVIRLLEDPILRQRLSKSALAWVREHYDWSKITEYLIAAINSTAR